MSLRHRYWWVPTLLLAVGMTACQHKHLSDEGDCPSPHQELRVEALYRQDWEIPFRNGTVWEENWPADFGMDYKDLRPFLPQGFRMSFYNGDALLGSTNLPTHGRRYYRQKGNYSLLFFNNDSEYIVFEGMDRLSTARASTRVVDFGTVTEATQSGTNNTQIPANAEWESYYERFLVPLDSFTAYEVTFTANLFKNGEQVGSYAHTAAIKNVTLQSGYAYNFKVVLTPSNINPDAVMYPIEFTVTEVDNWVENGPSDL